MGKASMDSCNFGKTLKTRPGSCQSSPKLRWRQLRVVSEDHRRVRCGVLKRSHPMYLRQVEGPTSRAKYSALMKSVTGEEQEKKVPRHHGAMAPRNTTQYLMSVVYEDMEPVECLQEHVSHLYGELSPRSVDTALDAHVDFLDYQLRDFEEAFGVL